MQDFRFLKQKELLLESYQRVGMRKDKEREFTTDRDPTGGVFETKTSFQTSFQISYLFFNKDIEISFLKGKCFIIDTNYP